MSRRLDKVGEQQGAGIRQGAVSPVGGVLGGGGSGTLQAGQSMCCAGECTLRGVGDPPLQSTPQHSPHHTVLPHLPTH